MSQPMIISRLIQGEQASNEQDPREWEDYAD